MKKIFLMFIIGIFTLSIGQSKPLDLHTLLKSSKVNIDYKALDTGEIVYTSREDLETTDTSIAVVMGLYIKGDYKEVLKDFKAQNNNLSLYSGAKAVEIKELDNIKPYFNTLVLTEKEELERISEYSDGNEFNFSENEIVLLNSMRQNGELKAKESSKFFQKILETRVRKYLLKGVNGISTYEHSSKDLSVKNDIKTSSLHFHALKSQFPKLYRDYLAYPNVESDLYEQKFYWLKDKIEDRVTFILKHQMIEEKNNFFIILERQFYISNGLDTMQTQILCMPYKKGTFIALSSQSFTPKVSGFARAFSVRIGRHIMNENIRPLFEHLQKKYNLVKDD